MTLKVHDEFTEASDTELSLHTPSPIGTSWTEDTGGTSGTFNIEASTDRCKLLADVVDNYTAYQAQPGPTSADQTVSSNWTHQGGGTRSMGLAARRTDASNAYAVGVLGSLSNTWSLVKRSGGSNGTLGSFTLALGAGDLVELETIDEGANVRIKVRVASVEKLNILDSSSPLTGAGEGQMWTGSLYGIGNRSGLHYMDNFKLDEIAAGGAAATGSQVTPAIIAAGAAALIVSADGSPIIVATTGIGTVASEVSGSGAQTAPPVTGDGSAGGAVPIYEQTKFRIYEDDGSFL